MVVVSAHRSAVIERVSTSSVVASSHYSEFVRLCLPASPFAYTQRLVDVRRRLPPLVLACLFLSRRRPWTTYIVHGFITLINHRRAWTGCIALGVQKMIRQHQALPGPLPLACTIVTRRRRDFIESLWACTHWSINISCGLHALPFPCTHSQPTFDVAYQHRLWPAHNGQST